MNNEATHISISDPFILLFLFLSFSTHEVMTIRNAHKSWAERPHIECVSEFCSFFACHSRTYGMYMNIYSMIVLYISPLYWYDYDQNRKARTFLSSWVIIYKIIFCLSVPFFPTICCMSLYVCAVHFAKWPVNMR